jgi:hypothetical protein
VKVGVSQSGQQHRDQCPCGPETDRECSQAVARVEIGRRADRSAGQHDAEQQQHDDGANVDQHLYPGDEFGGQQQVTASKRPEADHEP